MKTPIQELIEKYDNHLKNGNDLDTLSGRDVLKIVLVDLIGYQVKEKECIIEACKYGFRMDAESYDWTTDNKEAEQYYKETFKQE
jgi:hypothetical protein